MFIKKHHSGLGDANKFTKENDMQIVNIGGRIKSAGVGCDYLYQGKISELEERLRKFRVKPPREILEAFFPSDNIRMKKILKGIGFYRPMLKTDQGMGGNFLPFWINRELSKTDLRTRTISGCENVAIPEAWYNHQRSNIVEVQREFYLGNYKKVYQILERLGTRKAVRGRTSFFLIRPAETAKPVVFGDDICQKVEVGVNKLLIDICQEAKCLEFQTTGGVKDPNILYCQPDVYISVNGEIVVEKINMPDLGMFINNFSNKHSTTLPKIQRIVSGLGERVIDSFGNNISSRSITLITRDEVLQQQEDLLEIAEIKELSQGLIKAGFQVKIFGLSDVGKVVQGATVILMNIKYDNQLVVRKLIERHSSGEIICYPNPFVQMICQKKTGLKKTVIPSEFHSKFLALIGSLPKSLQGQVDVKSRIEKTLCQYGISSDILYIDTGVEIIPVFRHILHSWRQVALRVKKYKQLPGLRIIEIPVDFKRQPSLLNSSTGSRLHVYRFMFVN